MQYLLAVVLLTSLFMQQEQTTTKENLPGMSPTLPAQKSVTSKEDTNSATEADYAIIETVAVDLLKNKEYIAQFGLPKPEHPLPPRCLWIAPTTIPLFKFMAQANNADPTRDPDALRDGFMVSDDIKDSLAQRNQTSVSLAELRPKSKNVLLTPPYPQGPPPGVMNLEFKYSYLNTGWMKVWLPGFSSNGKLALVRFLAGPAAHGINGAYMLRKQGANWKIQWRYLRFTL